MSNLKIGLNKPGCCVGV